MKIDATKLNHLDIKITLASDREQSNNIFLRIGVRATEFLHKKNTWYFGSGFISSLATEPIAIMPATTPSTLPMAFSLETLRLSAG